MINKAGLSKSASAKIAEMSHTGFMYMMERKTMTVDALEKFANYFKVPISSFFESSEGISDELPKGKDFLEEPAAKYSCPDCVAKDKEIAALKIAVKALDELLDKYRKEKNE